MRSVFDMMVRQISVFDTCKRLIPNINWIIIHLGNTEIMISIY